MSTVFAPRTAWHLHFPDIITHCTVKVRDAHPDYTQAKSGNHNAAITLVYDLIADESLQALSTLIGQQKPVLVAVGAIEKNGYNAIPAAMAVEIGQRLGLPLDTGELCQINRVGHTRAPSWQRIVTPPLFGGNVEKGCCYVLVDDHVGVGGTLANLRGYIEVNGGHVIGMTTLTASREAERIFLPQETQNMLRSTYGQELENFWKQHFGYGLECLTAAEARNIARQLSFECIRDFLFKAADEADSGGIPPVASLIGQSLT